MNAAPRDRWIGWIGRGLAAVLLLALALAAYMLWLAARDPVARHVRFAVPNWPKGTPPVRLVLLSDLHSSGPDATPARLARIVARVNALRPDIVLIAGDFVSTKAAALWWYGPADAVAPLAGLRPRLGTVAVLGNHDHWLDAGAVRRALEHAGVRVLANQAVRLGPIAIGGLDDDFTHHADLGAVMRSLARAGGVPVLLSHSPDPFAALPAAIPLMLAGHTHCGQIVLPWIGALATASRYGARYRCGVVREHGQTLIVTAGIGTSIAPIRFGAPPDLWVVELGRAPPLAGGGPG